MPVKRKASSVSKSKEKAKKEKATVCRTRDHSFGVGSLLAQTKVALTDALFLFPKPGGLPIVEVRDIIADYAIFIPLTGMQRRD